MLENVAFGTHAKDAALDKDGLREGDDGECHMDKDVGRVHVGLCYILIPSRVWRGRLVAGAGNGHGCEHPSYYGPNEYCKLDT